jgi:glucan 1,3-beta-glucosidase
MASTPDLAGDKERGVNQFPSDHLLYPNATNRTKERYTSGGKEPRHRRGCMPTDKKKRRWVFIGVPVALVIIAAIIVGVLVGIDQNNKPKSGSKSAAGSGTGTGGGTGETTNTSTSGLDDTARNPFITRSSGKTGDTVTTDLGMKFVFTNNFDGNWDQDPEDPYSVSLTVQHSQAYADLQVSGRAQSFSPSLLEEWVWGKDIARG